MNNNQYVIYYVKQVRPIDEPDAPYQGLLVKAVGAIQGYTPTEQDVYEYAPPEGVESALAIQICLN